MNEYGFTIGDSYTYFIEADTEKEALIKLLNEKWDLIDEMASISMHGLVIEKFKGMCEDE